MKRRPPIPTAARSARAGQCASMTPSVYTRLGRGFVGAVLGILVACQPMDTGEGLLPPDEAGAALGLVGVAPSLGPTSGGLALTLSGTRFRPGMIVTVDGIPSPDVRVTSSTQLTAELPARESGSGAVVLAVKDPSGDTVERADLFRYYYGTVSFRTNYQVGHSMAGFAIADLNKDGSPDLISPYSRSTANISIAMGDGAGYFLPPSTVTALDRPYDVVVRDLNGDGNLDLVSTHQGATDISVLLGNGNGTFRPAVSYPVDTSFGSSLIVRAADVDGDGKLDLVLSDRAQAVINILRGSGDGSFVTGTPIDLRAKVSTIAELSTADLNADGKIDLITANSNENSVALLIGAGGGAFLSPIYASVYQPDTLATADLNGDSKVDVVTSSSDGSVSVLIGNGNGTMKASVRTIIGSDARSVSIADLNADGKPDLVVPSQDTGSLGILFGKGDGTFGPTAAYPAGGVLDRVVVADAWTNSFLPQPTYRHLQMDSAPR